MAYSGWKAEIGALAELLGQLQFTFGSGPSCGVDEAFAWWCERCVTLRENHGTCYFIGNGASASMASHIAADLAKNAQVHTQVFTDLSLITSVGNDMGYDQVFAEPLRRRAQPIDMLVAISSSGNSPNILMAADVAREIGATVVSLTAMSPDNRLRAKGDLNLYVPAMAYGRAESCHAAILHYWVDLVIGQ